jgi:hypothetical protein
LLHLRLIKVFLGRARSALPFGKEVSVKQQLQHSVDIVPLANTATRREQCSNAAPSKSRSRQLRATPGLSPGRIEWRGKATPTGVESGVEERDRRLSGCWLRCLPQLAGKEHLQLKAQAAQTEERKIQDEK